MSQPLDHLQAEQLVISYQAATEPERSELFSEIVALVAPLIRSTIFRHRWDLTLAESAEDLTNEIVCRLPKILSSWCPGRGSSFASYFISGMLNDFRHRYSKRQRRSRYHGDWPLDADGHETDIPDVKSQVPNGSVTTRLERSCELEQLIDAIPGELCSRIEPEFSGLVHYLAVRILARADNSEPLYFTELHREVAAFPAASSLNKEQIDALIRMTVTSEK